MTQLIIMACSGMKLARPAPAMELYQGVMYSTFRVHASKPAPKVVILSALHGFVAPEAVLEPYDLKMTASTANAMLANIDQTMAKVVWPKGVEEVMLVGGLQYRRVMRKAIQKLRSSGILPYSVRVLETSGGIGVQRSQLGRYLDAINPDKGIRSLSPREKEIGRALERARSLQVEVEAHMKEVAAIDAIFKDANEEWPYCEESISAVELPSMIERAFALLSAAADAPGQEGFDKAMEAIADVGFALQRVRRNLNRNSGHIMKRAVYLKQTALSSM